MASSNNLCLSNKNISREYCSMVTASNHEKSKNIVRKELLNAESSKICMSMIDALQNLVVDYHFQEEITMALTRQCRAIVESSGRDDNGTLDLYDVSLCFRLLRQQGYHVSADVFNKFIDKDGKFKVSSTKEDVRGMLSLYEAADYGIEGEDSLENVKVVILKQLHTSLITMEHDLAKLVEYTLECPSQKRLPRFMTKQYMELYEKIGRKNDVLLEFAKMDFNIVQALHKKELEQFVRWWKDLGLAEEMEFARNQPLKWYTWSMATLSERFSEERIELTKPIALIYMMDDIFDVYGTLDELLLFAQTINMWDLKEMEHMPDKMKKFCRALFETTETISLNVFKEHGWNPLDSLRNAWTSLCNAFLVEAKWFASGHVPGTKDYLKNAIISTGVHVVFVHIFFLIGESITKQTLQLMDQIPSQVYIVATILRLWDDMGSAKDENQEGNDGSYIKCYMKENNNSTMESARQHVLEMISNSWKQLNRECLSANNPFSPSFTNALFNAARMVSLMYNYDENQQLPTLEKLIQSTIFESIPL
ncbi:hypothetical protein Sjap_003419 [Stephania japonica]|uniref:Uncharacterized protein n=1 Tax=Stephania japonica TaxID=461633 RepID=A0AAP0KR50_9MAGN